MVVNRAAFPSSFMPLMMLVDIALAAEGVGQAQDEIAGWVVFEVEVPLKLKWI